MPVRPLRVLDVCSGYSAATLAWAGLPFRHVGYAEIEAFPRAVLEQRHGATPVSWDHRWREGSNTIPLFHDFTKIEAHHVGPVDLLAGGTPCQSFSVAGRRLGLDDPRGNLTLEFLALAKRVRAEWLLWENVPGFLSDDEGRTMGTFLRLLGELGYGFAWRVLDVQFVRVDGAERAIPQRRRRLFVVGHLGDAAGPAAVLFDRQSLRGDPAPRREAGSAVAALTSTGVGTCGADDNQAQAGHLIGFGGGRCSGPIESAACLTAKGMRIDFEVETMLVSHALRAEGFDASEDGTGRGTPIVPVAAAGWAVRRLTPTECERLMGVPDGFTAITYRGKPASDGPRYKCLGNSQGTNVMRWLGRGIADVAAIIERSRAA